MSAPPPNDATSTCMVLFIDVHSQYTCNKLTWARKIIQVRMMFIHKQTCWNENDISNKPVFRKGPSTECYIVSLITRLRANVVGHVCHCMTYILISFCLLTFILTILQNRDNLTFCYPLNSLGQLKLVLLMRSSSKDWLSFRCTEPEQGVPVFAIG